MPSAIVFIITEEIQFLITNIYAFILEEDILYDFDFKIWRLILWYNT